MKGSPMARNFGIGSPLHKEEEEEKEKKIDPKFVGTEEHQVWSEHEGQQEEGTIDVGKKEGYNRITDDKGDFVYYMPKMTKEGKRAHYADQ